MTNRVLAYLFLLLDLASRISRSRLQALLSKDRDLDLDEHELDDLEEHDEWLEDDFDL